MEPAQQTERDQQLEAASAALAAYREAYWEYRDHGATLAGAQVALRAAGKLADQVTELMGYTSRLFRQQSRTVSGHIRPDPFGDSVVPLQDIRTQPSVTRTAWQQGEPASVRDAAAGCRTSVAGKETSEWIGPGWSRRTSDG
jgi:hypothetical protein